MTDKMIVLADLGRVRAFRVTYDPMTSRPQLVLIYDCEIADTHGRVLDKAADPAGRFAGNGSPGASNRENHNMRIETERRLIRLVAEKISELAHGQRYWYLAAGEGINGRIVEQLPADTRSRLYKNVSADLVKTPRQEIMEYFMPSAA